MTDPASVVNSPDFISKEVSLQLRTEANSFVVYLNQVINYTRFSLPLEEKKSSFEVSIVLKDEDVLLVIYIGKVISCYI